MNPDKKYIVDELLERVNSSPFVLVVEYSGMTVTEFADLRNKLSEAGSECHVAKNTFMKKTLELAELPALDEYLKGQTAFVTGEEDVCAAAKAVKSFIKENKKPEIKIGLLDGDIIEPDQINALAELPSRDELLAQLLSVINAPATKLVRTINEPAGSLARVLQAKADKGE